MRSIYAASFVSILLPLQLAQASSSNGVCEAEYHADPIVDWAPCEKGALPNRAEDLERLLGKKLKIQYDRKSFETHYKAEEKKADPDPTSPIGYCDTNAIGFLNDSGRSGGIYNVLTTQGTSMKIPDTAKKEFAAKVNTITCAYDGDVKHSPRVELKGDNLIFHVRGDIGSELGIGHGPGWVIRDLKTALPEFKKVYDEYFGK